MESPVDSTAEQIPPQEEGSVCQLEALLACGSSYVDAKVASLKASAGETLLRGLVKGSAVFFKAMILCVAVLFLMYGMATGAGRILGDRAWIGFVLTGGSVVLGQLFLTKRMLSRARKNSQSLTRKATIAKSSFLKTSVHVKQDLSEVIDVRKWTQAYPFCATGVAAATGFMISARSPLPPSYTPKEPASSVQLVFMTMLIKVAEDALKELAIPLVKEHLATLSREESKEATKGVLFV